MTPPPDAYLSDEGLDEWARDTNGAPFSEETKEELVDFLDCTDDGCLTYVLSQTLDVGTNREFHQI